ncbi:MAG: dienelactone hydrolase family protein [Rhodospirillaceae bacterium]|jgi:carboxymethylenebutenolidase|nr:dienelactone hydrolase family protein [Rhodospirillaceae bacterium]MBT5665286.1 dienelactone hydrolase family protein [Rhodospirillaceae bacterium]MBT5810136.1 dienelactone hydrolase family protein [Rhodospirillaceae bacterium]
MNDKHIDIKTVDGIMPTYTCWPDGDGPFPAIVFYMDAPGIREELHEMARRMASDGYFVILPDLFYRFGTLRFPLRDANARKIWQTAMANLSNANVMDDTRAMLSYMDDQPQVKSGAKACIGYCMSGRLVTAAAGTFPDIFAANASLYGVGIVTDKEDSSHFLVKNIKGEMYFGFAETDSTVPDFVVPTLTAELEKHGANYTLETHPGTNHGFCFASRDVYNEAAAEKVHALFMDMCARHLS